jgi:hypothetical protein
MTTTALQIFEGPGARRASLLQLAVEKVACKVHLISLDPKRGVATYEILLANQADVGVSCRLYCVDRKNLDVDLGTLEVDRQSFGRSRFTVTALARRRAGVIFVEILGEGIHLLSEVRLPAIPKMRETWFYGPLLAAIAGAGWIALSQHPAWWIVGPPQIELTTQAAQPGGVTATYDVSRANTATYTVTDADGTVLGSGNLGLPAGQISYLVPPEATARDVNVTIDANGVFGHETGSVLASVLPIPPPSIARVVSMEAHRETYGGETSILASYLAVADRGVLQVVGANGKVLVSEPFSRAGTTRLALPDPAPPDDEALETVLRVERHGSHATASVEIPPANTVSLGMMSVAAPDANANAQGLGASGAASGSLSVPLPSDPIAFKARELAGDPFDVMIRRHLPQMHLALQDDSGTSLEEHDVPEGTPSVTFTAPRVAEAANYFVVLSYSRSDSSEDTLVRSLRVIPQP